MLPEQITPAKDSVHFKDWPNAAGFNALEDHREPEEYDVIGSIPSYAAGALYRTGPGGYRIPVDGRKTTVDVSHWFDGYTVVHKFELIPSPNGVNKVKYSSYCQVDELVERVHKTGRREEMSFGQKRDPCEGLYRKIKSVFTPPPPHGAHSANVGVVFRDTLPQEHTSKGTNVMTVVTDTNMSKHFDADTLEPLGVTDQSSIHPSLTGPLSAAHAATDPVTGDIFNYNLAFVPRPTYRIFKATPDGKTEILASISGKDIHPSYLHSINLTENFVILCIWPAFYSMSGAGILWTRNLLEAIQPFDPNAKATWLVIDRKKGRGVVKKFTSPAFFCFHTVNAWEEPDIRNIIRGGDQVNILCELVEFQDLSVLHWFYYENMVSDASGAKKFDSDYRAKMMGGLARYKLRDIPLTGEPDTSKASLADKVLMIDFPDAGDLPRINPAYALKKHRYVWGVLDRQQSSFVDGLGKTDTLTQECLFWDHVKHTPGEPIFIPKPGSTVEDEGVVLSVVLDGEKGTSYLLCLDAQTMKEVGRVETDHPVGFGFHGTFRPHSDAILTY